MEPETQNQQINCHICKKKTAEESHFVHCIWCGFFYHFQCVSIPLQLAQVMKIPNIGYQCEQCLSRNVPNLVKRIMKMQETEISPSSVGHREIVTEVVSNLSKVMEEEKEIERRKNNLVIIGLPETEHREQHKEQVKNVLDILDVQITQEEYDVQQIARGKMLVVKLKNEKMRNLILSRSRRLNDTDFTNVFLCPDRTKKQREEHKSRVAELKARKQKGEQVIIYRDQIIDKKELERRNSRRELPKNKENYANISNLHSSRNRSRSRSYRNNNSGNNGNSSNSNNRSSSSSSSSTSSSSSSTSSSSESSNSKSTTGNSPNSVIGSGMTRVSGRPTKPNPKYQ